MRNKCDCYHMQKERRYTYHPLTGQPIEHDVEVGVCWGTKERDECSCGGDKAKCDFYSEVREKAKKETLDVVAVVRCKGCTHGRPIDKTKSPEKYFKDDCIVCTCEEVIGDEPMIYSPIHFCSYGTPKERGTNNE